MAGTFVDHQGNSHGFVCGGPLASLNCHHVDVRLNKMTVSDTMILALTEEGVYGGSYRDDHDKIHGFVFHDNQFISIDVPHSVSTVVTTIGSPQP
jgi:hypothetical protein